MESVWLKKLLDGSLVPARRVIIQLNCQNRTQALRHLMSFEITRFHEDEAITNRRGITERGTDDRGIIYCRLTDFGHELSRVLFSDEGRRLWTETKRKEAVAKVEDAIFR